MGEGGETVGSSQRDARSSSLQRMVRRFGSLAESVAHIVGKCAWMRDWRWRWNYLAEPRESRLDRADCSLVLRGELLDGRRSVERVAKLLVFECGPRLALFGGRGAMRGKTLGTQCRAGLERECCGAKSANNNGY